MVMRRLAGAAAVASVAVAVGTLSGPYLSASSAEPVLLPEIRISPMNRVPGCVTPERLMQFLVTRNRNLDPRFRRIAEAYRYHGEAWRVRWDYAFFQMALETNFLSYRQPNGRMGDVDPRQNNFAGIGTTGGGVPGDRFPDVSSGVLGQIQHLVAYSGEYVAQPVAERTRLKQVDILRKSHELRRPVRFSDLARRWAADPRYASSIEFVAQSYRQMFCRGQVQPWSSPDAERAQHPGFGAPPRPVMAPPPQGYPRPAEFFPWQAPPQADRPVQKPPVSMLTTGSIDKPKPIVTTVWQREQPAPAAPETAAFPEAAPVEPEAEVEAETSGFALFKVPEWLATATPDAASLPPPSGLGVKP